MGPNKLRKLNENASGTKVDLEGQFQLKLEEDLLIALLFNHSGLML